MKRINARMLAAVAMAAATTILAASAAIAQGPGGPPPGAQGYFAPPPPDGQGGPEHFGPPPGGFGREHAQTALNVPMDILTAELKLTSDQVAKVQAVKDQFDQDREALMPPPGYDSAGPPDPASLRSNMDKLHAKEQDAVKNINALLTDSQLAALKGILKTLRDLRTIGIPPAAYEDLNLTSTQKTKFAAIARERREKSLIIMASDQGPADEQTRTALRQLDTQTRLSALVVLTDDQKDTISDYMADNPPPGDMPGPPPGGLGGPPPGQGAGPGTSHDRGNYDGPRQEDAPGPPPGDAPGPPPPGN